MSHELRAVPRQQQKDITQKQDCVCLTGGLQPQYLVTKTTMMKAMDFKSLK